MQKNKKTIFLIVILGFLAINYVSAKEINTSPTEPPIPTLMETKAIKPNLIPSLVQQEIEKAKALRKRTNQINISSNNLQNTSQNQETVSTINQTKQNRNDEVKNRRVEQIKRYTRNVAERFKALITREYQIKNRIQTRVGKIEENGFDMSSAKQILTETDENFEIIKNKVELMRSEINAYIKSTDLETVTKNSLEDLFKKVREETISLKKEIQDIHTKLVQTVKIMKEKITEKQSSTE